ncbi:MAG: COX15/CtaA family protein [Gemmatimonadetes bacterium]|nr:COX15/CtaA family protein [Gemmatimonadota bacterium]
MTRTRTGQWLAIWAVMVALTVVIGGITRLTESGLSITEWRPVSGVLPPIGQAAWEAEFAKYRQIPEFQLEAPNMTLAGFKRIFFWEYLHRLWARVVGLAIAVPGLLGLARGWFPAPIRGRVIAMGFLTLGQGALGWFMVRSGLSGRTDVSQYRLAAHLGLALVLFMVALWTAADLLARRDRARPDAGRVRRLAGWTLVVVFVTIMAGAFVAGTNAGKIFNEFPLMGGRVVPAGYLRLEPWWTNPFANVIAIQFNHRVLAVVSLVVVSLLGWRAWRAGAPAALSVGLMAVVGAQFVLGLVTLLWSVPVSAAALHQLGAVALLGLVLLAYHWARGGPPATLDFDSGHR